jgi:chaperone BCS1
MDINGIIETIKNNQLLLAGIGLSGAGIITFWVKDVPRIVYASLKREFTTELLMTSANSIFHDMMKWIEKRYSHKNFRKLKLSNGQWGYNTHATTSIGYGAHCIRYNGVFLVMTLTKDAANQSSYDKETLSVVKLGRSRKLFDKLVKEVQECEKDSSKIEIYKMEDSWMHVKDQKKRNMDSIFIEKDKKDLLIRSLSNFIKNEEWYLSHGIPYQLGILLYGAPGTGKTSLIKAISGYLDYPIYYLSPQKLSKIETAMSTLRDKCVVVVEDIDSNFLTHSRAIKSEKSEEDNMMEGFAMTSLSEILNSLDGMFSAHGRILIATTNHVENLDPALTRPGRIDVKIEIGYVNNEILKYFIDKFYPGNHVKIDINIKPKLTVAMLQNLVLQGYSENEIVEFSKV